MLCSTVLSIKIIHISNCRSRKNQCSTDTHYTYKNESVYANVLTIKKIHEESEKFSSRSNQTRIDDGAHVFVSWHFSKTNITTIVNCGERKNFSAKAKNKNSCPVFVV